MNHFRYTQQRSRNKAFTLVEVLVAGSISVVFLGAAAVFIYFVYEQMFAASEETRFNSTVRQLSSTIAEDIIDSAWFAVYPSFTAGDRDAAGDRVSIGNGGNLLVLYYTESVLTTAPSHEVVTRIVGYYADMSAVDSKETVPVMRFEVTPATGVTWYYNPLINPANYSPPAAITADASFTCLEDYFSGVSTSHASLTKIAQVELPTASRPLFYNQNSVVTLTAGTLFGNTQNNMRQTFSFSAAPQG